MSKYVNLDDVHEAVKTVTLEHGLKGTAWIDMTVDKLPTLDRTVALYEVYYEEYDRHSKYWVPNLRFVESCNIEVRIGQFVLCSINPLQRFSVKESEHKTVEDAMYAYKKLGWTPYLLGWMKMQGESKNDLS